MRPGTQRSRFAFQVSALCVIQSLLLPGSAMAEDPRSDLIPAPSAIVTSVSSEVHFDSWQGTRGTNIFDPARGSGWQLYAPTTGQLVAQWDNSVQLSTAVRTGYIYSSHDTPGQQGYYNGSTDTQLTGTLAFLNWGSVLPFTAVAMNLPTGKSELAGNQRFLRMDPDLVDLGSLGEGFNVTPSIGFTIAPVSNLAITPSVSYAFRGDFDRDALTIIGIPSGTTTQPGIANLHPGDIFTAAINTTYKLSDAALLSAAFSYMNQTNKITQGGVEVGQPGDQFVSNVALAYAATADLKFNFNGSWSYGEKNKVPLNGMLATEAKDTNTNVFIGTVQPVYSLDNKTRLGMSYSILYRDQNSYNFLEEQFIPAKLKQTVGLLGEYDWDNSMTLGLKINRFWMHQNTGAFLETVAIPQQPPTFEFLPPSLDYQGWQIIATLSKKF